MGLKQALSKSPLEERGPRNGLDEKKYKDAQNGSAPLFFALTALQSFRAFQRYFCRYGRINFRGVALQYSPPVRGVAARPRWLLTSTSRPARKSTRLEDAYGPMGGVTSINY